MGDIVQIRVLCCTQDRVRAAQRWPQLCALARTWFTSSECQFLYYRPQWAAQEPMPGVWEMAQFFRAALFVERFPEALVAYSATVQEVVQNLERALGGWHVAAADEQVRQLCTLFDSMEGRTIAESCAELVENRVAALTWNPSLLDDRCPILCALWRQAKGHKGHFPASVDDIFSCIAAGEFPWPASSQERQKPLETQARKTYATLQEACQERDPRRADRISYDLDRVLDALEQCLCYRSQPPSLKQRVQRFFKR